ncbi:MAG: DUF1501 domain-containing protein [Saprospiraceae bacterium]|nr:DUF1501 domain-containing protein [Saprospiraceae bacterium]
MSNNKYSRRKFIGQASCAAIGSTTLFNTLLNLKAINALALSNSALDPGYKALVCINLSGGNDSFNMLVPMINSEYNVYKSVRSNLALSKEDLLKLRITNQPNKEYGLHPSMPELQKMIDSTEAAIIANVGTILAPTTKDDFYNNKVPLPLGLFSHSDQSAHWQTGIPQSRTNIGWGGRMSDLIHDMNSNDKISMNISLEGTNYFETGNELVEYVVDPRNGAIGIDGYRPGMYDIFNINKAAGIDSILNQTHKDIFKKTYIDLLVNSRDGQLQFADALDTFPDSKLTTQFSDNNFSRSLQMITRIIALHETLGFKRQIFYVNVSGWDHHDEVLNTQAEMLRMVSQGLNEFNQALKEIKLFNQVTTFNISEFGRTLTSNGNGSDHAWGGNCFVMGGAVSGAKMFGKYPSLDLNSNLNVYEGSIIPTTPVDLYFADLALWMGVPKSELSYVLPNIGTFYDVNSSNKPLGIFK